MSSGLAPIGPGAQGMMPMWTLGGEAAGASMIPPGALWVLPPPSVAVAPSSQSQIWTFPRAPQIINLTAVRPVSTDTRFTTTASGVNVARAAEVQHSAAPPVAAACAPATGGKRELQLMSNPGALRLGQVHELDAYEDDEDDDDDDDSSAED
ncbi:hypothetical protein MUK42_18076 [Musa troglodytarum]|uniref:Uncharacterized protein n=1 Tax=Musa troglodytarum TaxID=320322 RepID=A0A9E7HCR8_9LILI|nr:hypothetical protein MUK42_18076 [Musa troglodytarum]